MCTEREIGRFCGTTNSSRGMERCLHLCFIFQNINTVYSCPDSTTKGGRRVVKNSHAAKHLLWFRQTTVCWNSSAANKQLADAFILLLLAISGRLQKKKSYKAARRGQEGRGGGYGTGGKVCDPLQQLQRSPQQYSRSEVRRALALLFHDFSYPETPSTARWRCQSAVRY